MKKLVHNFDGHFGGQFLTTFLVEDLSYTIYSVKFWEVICIDDRVLSDIVFEDVLPNCVWRNLQELIKQNLVIPESSNLDGSLVFVLNSKVFSFCIYEDTENDEFVVEFESTSIPELKCSIVNYL